ALATASISSSTPTSDSLWSISIRALAKCTLTLSTPLRRPMRFSILLTHDGQEKPSARKMVWVLVVAVMIGPFVYRFAPGFGMYLHGMAALPAFPLRSSSWLDSVGPGTL